MRKIASTLLSLFWTVVAFLFIALDSINAGILEWLLFIFIFILSISSGFVLYRFWDGKKKSDKIIRITAFFLPVIPGMILGTVINVLLFFKNL